MFLIRLWISLFLFAFTLPAFSDESIDLQVNGLKRSYILHIPANAAQSSTPLPLVLMLHGMGGSADTTAKSYGWEEKADREMFIVAFPEATPMSLSQPINPRTNLSVWNDGSGRGNKQNVDDIAFLRAVVDDVANRTFLDRNKIYCTGFSNGASMTLRAGIDMSDTLAAIAPVAGNLYISQPKPKRTMSMMLIVGAADPLNPLVQSPANPSTPMNPHVTDSVFTWLRLLNLSDKQKMVNVLNGVTTTLYGPNPEGKKVIFIVVAGQGHVWPGSINLLPTSVTGPSTTTFNATNAIWEFFKSQNL